MSLSNDIKYKLKSLNVLEKIIGVNVIAYVIGLLFQSNLSWFELPSSFGDFLTQPWALISYAFLHYDFFHILFNMLWLYVIGRMFLSMFSSKMAVNIYFLGAMSGGLLFMLGYTLLPSLFGADSRLVGASAAVRALLIFICAYMPYQDVRLFMFNIKLWHIGLFIVVLDVVGLFGLNAGGNLAHLGGATLGYVYAKQLIKGNDIGKGFERLLDSLSKIFKASKKAPLKTVYKNKGKVGGYTKGDFNEFNHQKQIDIILDKISKSGYDSLTAEEKEFLFKSGK
ncbi:rhomboid family intramembrane serine protease [Mariniflexile aquimaris]|uniref:Rhomboid family intramembrane serine protease n=1 Tax=Mariniflexile aquimaris TaxID=881009 RepID=A0ABW3BSC1_9FLAO